MNVTVVVLGDLGRSPRVLYHAQALLERSATVDLVGYDTTPLPARLLAHAGLVSHALRALEFPAVLRLPAMAHMLVSALRFAGIAVALAWTLGFRIRRPDLILVATPPAIPALALVALFARLRGARWIVDWHNFGYSMLGLRLGKRHPVVRVARWWEKVSCRGASAHLCVSRAMCAELAAHWGIGDAVVHYDLPARQFAPIARLERDAIVHRLGKRLGLRVSQAPLAAMPRAPCSDPDRAALIVSATSWTLDEDFNLLLGALRHLDTLIDTHDRATPERAFPHLDFLITGEGRGRRDFDAQVATLRMTKLALRTAWLSAEDYAAILGCADLGLCLHRSSSGLDLPMKLADMLGAGLPVCVLDYAPCLRERVHDGRNAWLFGSAEELAGHLYTLFKDFPRHTPALDAMREHIQAHPPGSWDAEWERCVKPLIEHNV